MFFPFFTKLYIFTSLSLVLWPCSYGRILLQFEIQSLFHPLRKPDFAHIPPLMFQLRSPIYFIKTIPMPMTHNFNKNTCDIATVIPIPLNHIDVLIFRVSIIEMFTKSSWKVAFITSISYCMILLDGGFYCKLQWGTCIKAIIGVKCFPRICDRVL